MRLWRPRWFALFTHKATLSARVYLTVFALFMRIVSTLKDHTQAHAFLES